MMTVRALGTSWNVMCLVALAVGVFGLIGLSLVTFLDFLMRVVGQFSGGLFSGGLYDFELVETTIPIFVSAMMPYTHRRGFYISILLVRQRLRPVVKQIFDSVIHLLLALCYILLSWQSFLGAWSFFQSGEISPVLSIQRWWGAGLMSFFLAMTVVSCMVRLIDHLVNLINAANNPPTLETLDTLPRYDPHSSDSKLRT